MNAYWHSVRVNYREWRRIEKRLRNLGVADTIFDADFDEQQERAVARFEASQDRREAAGLEREQLPEDLRELVTGCHCWWGNAVQRRAKQTRVDAIRRVTEQAAAAERKKHGPK